MKDLTFPTRRFFLKIVIILIGYAVFPFFVLAQAIDADNLTDPKILKQLDNDPTLMVMEKGALFVPYIVDPKLEPRYTIFQGKKFVTDAPPGKRILLFPGKYTVFIGSVSRHFQQQIEVEIKNERVTVLLPTWSALIIKTIDQNNNDIRKSYSIIDEKDKIQIASGTGADILRGEKDQIWILKPSLYRIAKKGESPYSFQNFVTVNTQPGNASTVLMIFDETTNTILGGGEVMGNFKSRKQNEKWSFNANIFGNFALVNSGYLKGGTGSINNFTFGANLNVGAVYDDDHFLFINRMEINEQFQKSAGEKLRFIKDLMKFDTSFVYLINRYFGPYISVRVRTPFAYRYFTVSNGKEKPVTVVEEDGTQKVLSKDGNFVYSKSFSTTILQEGLGLNADYSYENIFTVTGRLGWGLREDFNPFSYDISKLESDYTVTRLHYFTFLHGPEFYFYLSWFPFSIVEIKEEFDALLPISNVAKFNFLSKSSVSFWISRFAMIQYEFEVEKSASSKSTDTIIDEHTVTVQIYYNFL